MQRDLQIVQSDVGGGVGGSGGGGSGAMCGRAEELLIKLTGFPLGLSGFEERASSYVKVKDVKITNQAVEHLFFTYQ